MKDALGQYHLCFNSAWRSSARQRQPLSLLVLLSGLATAPGQTREHKPLPTEELEKYDDPPALLWRTDQSPRMVSQFNAFTSFQVNVDANGQNITGDAANEPSISVDPTNHNRMAIGWRQFDSVLKTSGRRAGVTRPMAARPGLFLACSRTMSSGAIPSWLPIAAATFSISACSQIFTTTLEFAQWRHVLDPLSRSPPAATNSGLRSTTPTASDTDSITNPGAPPAITTTAGNSALHRRRAHLGRPGPHPQLAGLGHARCRFQRQSFHLRS